MSQIKKHDKSGLWGVGRLLGNLSNPGNIPEYTHEQHATDVKTAAKIQSAIEKQRYQRETLIPKIMEYIKESAQTFKARFAAQTEAYEQGKSVKDAEAQMLIAKNQYERHVQGLQSRIHEASRLHGGR